MSKKPNPLEIIKSLSKDGSITGPQGERLTVARGVEVLQQLRQNGFDGRPIDEWQTDLETRLGAHPQGDPLYVFGYGSLMWNPMIPHEGLIPASIQTYARSFCMNVTFGRGSDDHPGLMLALDEREGHTTPCWGRLIAVKPEDVEHAYTLLWIREMGGNGYVFRRLAAQTADGPVPAITFTINRAGDRYLGHLPLAEQAQRIAHAEGLLGTNHEYLASLMKEMAALNIEDPYLTALWAAVEAERS